MSIRWIDHVWQHSPYSGERLLVHLALADTAHDDGRLWITQAHLAAKARCSVEWVRKTIKQMQDEGVLHVTEKGTRGRATVYALQEIPPTPTQAPLVITPTELGETALHGELNNPNSNSNNPNSNTNNPNSTRTTSVLYIRPTHPTTPPPDAAQVDAGQVAAAAWWERQSPRPIGKSAWHSLLAVCRAAAERGYEQQQIERALDAIGTVPSVQQMDRVLRNVQPQRVSARQERLARGASLVHTLTPSSPWELES